MNDVVPLDRRFIPWTSDESGDADALVYLTQIQRTLSWDDLLEHRRVVILAEPGSGKSAEVDAQVARSQTSGAYTFIATVQNVGRHGLSRALGTQATIDFDAWRASDQSAWFFFDSIDEAKVGKVSFDDALREIADAIDGCRGRAHIVLTGRDTNWEIRRDLEGLTRRLALPPPDLPPTVDPNDLVIAAIRPERNNSENDSGGAVEEPLVVRMVPLDPGRVEQFARAKHVTDTERFLKAIDKSGLWAFASRPIDLDWLVDYWIAHGRFGTLCEMLELSIRKRLRETNPGRERQDSLDADRSLEALERVGAALVLQRLRDIEIPDGASNLGGTVESARLDEILSNWSGADLSQLISRAMFVPASAGYVRLHNDNEGAVSGFLAARWMIRLMAANCPTAEIYSLLFSTTYGLKLVIPSMRNTAAWLSVWNPDVARHVIECDPRLLMEAGDPGSLPFDIRENVLRTVVEQIFQDEYVEIPNRDSVKRFGQADMQVCIRDLWSQFESSPAARELLLMIIWLGDLESCSDIAVGASFGAYTDRYTPMFAGNALMATADDGGKRRYAEYIRDNARHCGAVVLWDAIRALFPSLLTIDDMLQILKAIDVTDDQEGLGFSYHGPKLIDKLETAAEVRMLLEGLLARLDVSTLPDDAVDVEKNEQYLPALEAAGRRLLELANADEAPEVAIDAAIRLCEIDRFGTGRRNQDGRTNLMALLKESPERRRLVLWRAIEMCAKNPRLREQPLTSIFQLHMIGFTPDFEEQDFDWLLADAENRAEANERKIAADAAMMLWKRSNENSQQWARLQALGDVDADVASVISKWTAPRTPSNSDREYQAQMARREQQRAEEQEARDQSWRDFADDLRANPQSLREAKPLTDERIDSNLYNLWDLLRRMGENHSHRAISDLTPLIPMFGRVVVDALRETLILSWRARSPTLSSERPPDERDTVYHADCIGIVGVTLEAMDNRLWASQLTHEEATKAAIYATIELNGFPTWIDALAKDQPRAVRDVLLRAMTLELGSIEERREFWTLSNVASSDASLASVIANDIYLLMEQHETITPVALSSMWKILINGYENRAALTRLATERFCRTTDWENAASHLSALYDLDEKVAIDVLISKLSDLNPNVQSELVQVVLSKLFGGWEGRSFDTNFAPFASLLLLVHTAFRTIRTEDDARRPSGECYTPNARDDAEQARGMLLKTLFDTPGLAAFEAIQQLASNPEIDLPRHIVDRRARERAAADSEHGVWSSEDVSQFEKTHLTAPRTPRDLQQLATRRLDELNYDLSQSDFTRGSVLAALPDEVDVQNWIADRLRITQRRNYSVEREAHVVGEKEPDICFEAKASDARVQLEIKVAESWTLKQLEDALQIQLVGQYLQDRLNHFGILLLVHQRPRPKGWQSDNGGYWEFFAVVEHLRRLAREIASESPDAPQVEVVVVDVSSNARE